MREPAPSVTAAPVIALRGVSKEFNGRTGRLVALDAIDLDVAPNEFAAVLGPSGCGKSTLLNMVAGFDGPTRGEVLFRGEPVSRPDPRRSVVFQEAALFPWFTVLDNITFGPKTCGVSAAQYGPRVETLLEQVGLRGFERHYPAELSGGMKQRVGIARVLIMEPVLLLMDEPFGSLDAQTRSVMQELLLSVWGAAASDRPLYHPRRRGGASARGHGLCHDGAAGTHQEAPGRRPAPAPHARDNHLSALQ